MKNILFALAVLLAAPATAQGVFTIEGYMKGVGDGTEITLWSSNLLQDGASPVLTKTVSGGRFTIRAEMPDDLMYMEITCNAQQPRRYLPVWMAAGKTTVVYGDGIDVRDWSVESDIPEQEEENFFAAVLSRYDERLNIISVELNRLGAMRRALEDSIQVWGAPWGVTKGVRPTEAQIDSINSSPKFLRATTRLNEISAVTSPVASMLSPTHVEKRLLEIHYLQEREVSQVWLVRYYWILNDVLLPVESELELTPETMRGDVIALYDKIPAAMLDTPIGREIARCYTLLTTEHKSVIDQDKASGAITVAKVEVGGPMADTDFFDLEGNVRHLSELTGGYILLDFWAYWCGPCTMAMPELGEVSDLYKGRLAVVSISRDSEKQWRTASAHHQITWHNFNAAAAGKELWRAYGISGIPHYALIAPDGTVIDMWKGYRKGSIKEKLRETIE
jgi:thiol-disulfide isomerase/thioredoxin